MSLEDKSTVKLISAEGFEFIIDRDAAMISNTIKNMLSTEGLVVEWMVLFMAHIADVLKFVELELTMTQLFLHVVWYQELLWKRRLERSTFLQSELKHWKRSR